MADLQQASISFVVVVVRTSLKNFDSRLEEAAADLGASGKYDENGKGSADMGSMRPYGMLST